MQTVQAERPPRVPISRDAQDVPARRLHAAARVVAELAGLLAFGLIGLLVAVWLGARRKQRAQRDCRGCRRRRYFALVVTFGLAALVLAGAGLAVHQHTNGPGLPTCETEPSARVQGSMERPSMDGAGGAAWSQSRQILTAPVSGLARGYVNDRGGGLCEGRSMTVAFLPSAASNSGLAVGGVVLIDAASPTGAGDWEALARHESRHVNQWATLTLAGGPLAMPLLYAVDDAFFPDSRNHFERAAGLEDGGYARVDDFGPRPDWTDVAILGLLVVAVFRRRIRWASRVLIGGSTAAAAHQPGLCPVHTRGWFHPAPATSRTSDQTSSGVPPGPNAA